MLSRRGSDSAQWVQFPAMNCYVGAGAAHDLGTACVSPGVGESIRKDLKRRLLRGPSSEEACRSKCEATLGCGGVTIASRSRRGTCSQSQIQCWLRGAVKPSACAREVQYDTWVRAPPPRPRTPPSPIRPPPVRRAMSWQVLNGSNCAQREHLLTTRLVKASDAAVLGRRGALDELDRRTHRACMDACEATSGCAAVTILKHVANFRTFAALCYLRRHFTKHQTSPRFWVTNTSACASRSAFDSYMLLNLNATSDTATTANTVNAGGGGVFFSWRPRRGFWDTSTVCEARTNAAQWLDERRRQAVDRCVAPSDRFDDCADCHRVPMGTAHRALLDAGWALNRSCPLDFFGQAAMPRTLSRGGGAGEARSQAAHALQSRRQRRIASDSSDGEALTRSRDHERGGCLSGASRRTAEAEWAQAGRHASGALHRESNPAQTQQASLCDER